MKNFAALAALLGLAACGTSAPPPRKAAAAPKPVVKDDEADKPQAPTSIYVYSPVGKRDPFAQETPASGMDVGRSRTKTVLEKWPLDRLKLALTVTGTSSPLAMVEDPDGRGWSVRVGDFIGESGGKVTGIRRDELVITETITDHSTGRVYPQTVKLTVPVTKEEAADLQHLREGEELRAAKGER